MAQKRRSFSPFGPQGRAPVGPEAPEPKPSVDEAASDFAGVVGGKPAASHDPDDDAVFGTEPPVAAKAPEPIGPPRSGGRWWEEPDAGTESKPAPESPEPAEPSADVAPVPSGKPEATRDDGWGAPDGQIVQPPPTPETGPAVGGNGGNWWDMPDDAEEPASETKPAFDATNRAVEADETPQEAPESAFDATNRAVEAAVDSTPRPDADGLHETPQPDSWFAAADTAGNAPRGDLWGAASETDDEEGWGGDEDEDGGWDDDEEEKPEPRSGRGLFGWRKAKPDDADADESEEEDWDDEGADDDWDDPDDTEEGPAEPAKRGGFLGFLGGRKAKPQSEEEADPDDMGGGDGVEGRGDPDDGTDPDDDEGWDDPDGTGDSDGWTDDEGSDGYDSLAERFDSAGKGVRVPWKPIVIGAVSIALVAGVGLGVHAKMRADAEAKRDAACKALAASWSDWKSAAKEADDFKIEHSKDVEQPCPVDVNAARAGAKNLDDKTAGLRSEIAKAKALAGAKESARKALEANPKATQETKDALNKALEGDDANEILKLSAKLPEEQKAAEEAERKAAEEKAKADAEAAKKAQEEEARRQAEAQAQAQQQQQQQQQQQYTPRRQYVAPKRPAYTPQQQTQPQQQQPQGGGSSSGSMGGSIG